jgi:peptide/nickel transport system permease protein
MNLNYILQRTVQFLVIVFLAVTVNFIVPRLIPGDPVEEKLLTLAATSSGAQSSDITAMANLYREKFGLDQPFLSQYVRYWGDILRGDLGYSLSNFPETVNNTIRTALPWTVGLVGVSTLVSFCIGSLLGGLLAWPSAPRGLRSLIPVLLVASAIPYFLLGIVLIYFLSIEARLFPAGGGFRFGAVLRYDLESVLNVLHHAMLPSVSIIVAGIGSWALGMRGMIINVLGEDFIMYARAKGLSERRIFLAYGLRNGLLPQLTTLALVLGYVVSGAILVEVFFSYPGIGYKLYQAVLAKDYFVIQGIVLILILAIAATLYILDLLYPMIDPRITYEAR